MKRETKFLHRMVFSYTLVFSVIFLLIMGLLYVILLGNHREEARLNNQMLINQPLRQLDRFFAEMDNVAYKAMTNVTLIQKFAVLRDEDHPGNYYDANVLDSIDTASVLAGINDRFAPARRISVYNDKGDFISSGVIVDRQKVHEVLKNRDVAGMMKSLSSSDRDYIISHPQKDGWSDYFKSEYFTLTRPVMNIYSRDAVGIVEVQRDRLMLEEYLRFSPDRPLSLNIYDEAGAPVMLAGSGEDVVVASATSEAYGWTIELLEPSSVMRGESLRLLGMVALVWLLLCVAVFMVINLIAGRMTKPLTDLTEAVKELNVSDPQEIHVYGAEIDEIMALESAFNQMLERLTLSADQEKKSFLLAMQAQMNPHFLYNVLSVINALALENKSEVIVKVCGNLSGMLRYSSSYARGSATMREELGHTIDYLKLMKARYDYMFHYSVHLDESLAGETIPKLIVQPLCENCFTHAFSNREPPYRVDIRVERVPQGWTIRVTDNGAGFDEQARLRALERTNHASYEDLNKMQIGGLGLVSSVVRLKLFTGKRVACDIQSSEQSGSSVVITVYDGDAAGREAVT